MDHASQQRENSSQAGFSFLELMIAVLLLSVISAAVFSQISEVQQRARAEQSKLDIFQESREFMDQVVRDLHQTGYPNIRMFDTSASGWSPALNATPRNDSRLAAGLLKIAPDEISFEGDVDGDGQVDVLDYKLKATGNNCPCLQRSQVLKSSGGTIFSTEVQNVQTAGTTADPVFVAYKSDGTVVSSADSANAGDLTTLASIKTVQITLKVKARVVDPKTHLAPETSLGGVVTLSNCSLAAAGQAMSCQ